MLSYFSKVNSSLTILYNSIYCSNYSFVNSFYLSLSNAYNYALNYSDPFSNLSRSPFLYENISSFSKLYSLIPAICPNKIDAYIFISKHFLETFKRHTLNGPILVENVKYIDYEVQNQ